MTFNEVRLTGTVKRSAEAGTTKDGGQVLDFALEVYNADADRMDIFDCRLTGQSDAMDKLGGYVEAGETIGVIGHLERRTSTANARLAGSWVEVRTTSVCVYVDDIEED